uniref:Uncharacterized protein n=1 Tax=Arundo donax TaxID=35708 RepID=A0A0A9C6Q1_ARUDO
MHIFKQTFWDDSKHHGPRNSEAKWYYYVDTSFPNLSMFSILIIALYSYIDELKHKKFSSRTHTLFV